MPREQTGTPYAQAILTVRGRAPLLAAPRLARDMVAALEGCRPDAPGRLWGYLVVPDAVQLVVGPVGAEALSRFVAQVKAAGAARLWDAIRRTDDDDALDAVLAYNPVRGGALVRVWEAGYHRLRLPTDAHLRAALDRLRQIPMRRGLTPPGEAWPYLWTAP